MLYISWSFVTLESLEFKSLSWLSGYVNSVLPYSIIRYVVEGCGFCVGQQMRWQHIIDLDTKQNEQSMHV